MLNKFSLYIGLLLLLFFFSNCSITRRVPDGQYLYTGASVKIDKTDKKLDTKALATDLNYSLYPLPNRRLFRIRWRLRTYNTFYSKKKKGLFHWISTTIGEEPVLYDAKNTESVKEVLKSKAINNGYFSPEVSHYIKA